jgi:hypothetical protein
MPDRRSHDRANADRLNRMRLSHRHARLAAAQRLTALALLDTVDADPTTTPAEQALAARIRAAPAEEPTR